MRESESQLFNAREAVGSMCGAVAPLDADHICAHTLAVRGPWIRAADLPDLFCSWDLAYRCTKAGWLKPILKGKRRTIYRLIDVFDCLKRIEAGELPSPRRKGTAS